MLYIWIYSMLILIIKCILGTCSVCSSNRPPTSITIWGSSVVRAQSKIHSFINFNSIGYWQKKTYFKLVIL